MRLMRRNLRYITYCLYQGTEPIVDEYGYETGENKVIYGEPKKLLCNVSAVSGMAQNEMFGTLDAYDRVVITDDLNCPIDENSILFIDTKYAFSDAPINDYMVKRVAKSLNYISYVVSKVKKS